MFKKASADFDEGGARGLLLNNLSINDDGRLCFDSSDNDEPRSDEPLQPDCIRERAMDCDSSLDNVEGPLGIEGPFEKYLLGLFTRHFPNLGEIDAQVLCPSMRDFDLGSPSSVPKSVASNGNQHAPGAKHDEYPGNSFHDQLFDDGGEVDLDDGGFGVGDPVLATFGNGGEQWATQIVSGEMAMNSDAAVTSKSAHSSAESPHLANGDFASVSLGYDGSSNEYNALLGFFDNILEKNWAGPEHWRIQRIRHSAVDKAAPATKRKEKDLFEIDFATVFEKSTLDTLFACTPANAPISLPRAQSTIASRNLLPDDKHFNSRDLLNLFLKPRASIGRSKACRSLGRPARAVFNQSNGKADAWANGLAQDSSIGNDDGPRGDYDANFFQDDNLGVQHGLPSDDDDDDFENALEVLPSLVNDLNQQAPQSSEATRAHVGPFGTQMMVQGRKVKPDYVRYAKSAKKIDVRQLKEELWRGIGGQRVRSCSLRLLFTRVG